MTVFAHVAGMPLEEALPALAGTGTALLAARAWLSLRLRRRRVEASVDSASWPASQTGA